MATQTVRTIYEAVVNQAQANLGRLARETDKTATSVDKLDQALDSAGKRDVTPEVDVDIREAEAEVRKLTQELDELEKLDADVRVEADVEAARGDLARAEADLSALQGAKAEMVVTVDADDVDLDEMGDAAESAGEDAGARAGRALLEGLNSTPVVGAVAGIVVAAGGFIASGVIDAIQERLRAEDVFGAQTGLDETTSRKFGAAAGAAYGNAWGDSVQDNLDTARTALANGLITEQSTGRDIQAVTEQLTAMSEILGVDVVEGAEAAGNMLKSGLAENAEDAFDIIITGQQEGLNRSEDWIDTLREYSQMFESLGLAGAEAGGLIEQAMDAGARNSDVAADALKEFSIRSRDDSKTTREAFEAMEMDADEMGKAFRSGGDEAREGLDLVLDGMRELDQDARDAVGVALFGTMWEDMGNGAGVLAMDLDDLSGSWVNVGDTSADAMDRMSDNAATAWESVKRNVTNAAAETLGGIAATFEDPIMDLSNWASTHTSDILGFLIDVGYGFFDLARVAVEFGASTIEVLGDVAGAFAPIVRGIADAVVGFGVLTGNDDWIDLGNRIGHASNDMEEFGENADGVADTLRTTVGGALDEAERKFEDWTGPAIMQAEINDAITVMIGRVDEFVEHVGGADAVVTINGDELPAEEALNSLITEVSESNGTVDINGDTVLAEDALDHVMALVDEGAEITVTANTEPAESSLDGIMANPPTVEVPITADTDPAQEDVTIWGSQVGDVPATVRVQADLYGTDAVLQDFYATMMEYDWTISVNGETVDAEETLAILLEEVNTSGGTVMINGTPVTAETSLVSLIDLINSSGGVITIDGDAGKAFDETLRATKNADNSTGTIDVDANTSAANSKIDNAARDRYTTIRVTTDWVNPNVPSGMRQRGFAHGGRVPGSSGYASGYGVVPAPAAPYGVDNILWPDYSGGGPGLATGGPVLGRPLAGGEWVVNPISSRQHDATLRAINAGATRAEIAAMNSAGRTGSSLALTQNLYGPDARVLAAESEARFEHKARAMTAGYHR